MLENTLPGLCPLGPMGQWREQTSLAGGLAHHAGHFAKNLTDAAGDCGHNRTGSSRYKTGHESVFDEILSVIVPPNAEPRDDIQIFESELRQFMYSVHPASSLSP
jgi:hypothetical protein